MSGNYRDKVAVITGAASGIGQGLAEHCCRKGMRVVLADIETKVLQQTETQLKHKGASVIAVQTDVSKLSDMQALAQKTLENFGAVHLLFNNAGVAAGTKSWESTDADWQWVIGVNLWGLIHSLRVFIPMMLKQKADCHIVNTASVLGLMSWNNSATYHTTKHAIVALSEQLRHELMEEKSKIKVSVFCPGFIKTQITEATRNRPQSLQNPDDPEQIHSDKIFKRVMKFHRYLLEEEGITPEQAAIEVFDAMDKDQFYIFANADEFMPLIKTRFEKIVQDINKDKV